MRRLLITLLVMVSFFPATNASAKVSINPPPDVESTLGARDLKDLRAERDSLLVQFNATQRMIDHQADNCRGVEAGSAKVSECVAEATTVKAAAKEYRAAVEQFKGGIANAQQAYKVLTGLKAMAKRLGWEEKEQERLAKALNALGADGNDDTTRAEFILAWQEIMARGQGGVLASEAARGDGPGFPGAGEQINFKDCAIFALANAAGVPYSVVAARATKLINEEEWRSNKEQADPQKVIEKIGLNGGEVIMLAESLGQAEVVTSKDFAKVLNEGRPVMVNVMPQGGGGHEVVLTKSFQHGGGTWYEMMDSNQGPVRRLYLSDHELNAILQENGVAFRPQTGTVPNLLR